MTGIELSKRLDELLQDEDLDHAIMQDAFEGLLPNISDYLNGVGPFQDGASLILRERRKQIEKHGFTGEHHANHPERYENFQLQHAAHALLAEELYEQAEVSENIPEGWNREWFIDLSQRSRRERLIIAGALIAAEIDRLLALK